MVQKWVINRVGLINFWFYDEEEFHFSNGKLLLRGSNGSGKSVTMQSFIPLLLDGNRSPERLDPFGSRARKMDNYLLGEEDTGQEERTGYLYMEFIKKNLDRYLTIGMGFQARRGKPLNSWGFSITDGRRIGSDFHLYKDIGEKVPYSRTELRNRIADGGEVYDGQRNYMEMVNKLLFGFENIDEYDELIKLLVQLRTPKLSKDFKPTVIYDIMNNAIQPLSDEDLRPMSEAIENMDNIKTQLEALRESKEAADILRKEYDRYNTIILLEKAENYLSAQKDLSDCRKEIAEQEEALVEFNSAYLEAEKKVELLKSDRKLYEQKKQELEKHDSFQAKQELNKREELQWELKARQNEKNKLLDEKKGREKKLRFQLKELEGDYQVLDRKINKIIKEMAELAEEFKFDEHVFASEEISKRPPVEYSFTYLKNELLRYRDRIVRGRDKLEKEEKQSHEYDRKLQLLDKMKKKKQDALRELERVQNYFDEIREEYLETIYSWQKNNTLVKLTDQEMVDITRIIRSYGEGKTYDDMIAELRKKVNKLESGILKKISSLESDKANSQEELKEKEAELEEWDQKKDPEPPHEEKFVLNRERMKKAGIPFISLYKAVDFRENLSSETRGILEEALLDMGLLDALIIPEEYREEVLKMDKGMADKYIFSRPQYMTHELSLLLKPEKIEGSMITPAVIEHALKSIVLNEKDSLTFLNEKGEYSIGVLKGKVSASIDAKYIGVRAREQYRQQIIEKLKLEIELVKDRLAEYTEQTEKYEKQLTVIEEEFNEIPPKDNLEAAQDMIHKARLNFENRKDEAERTEKEAQKTYELLKKTRDEVREITAKMYLPLNLTAYQEACEASENYRDFLSDLTAEYGVFKNKRDQIASKEEQIEDVLLDIDNYQYDLNRLENEIRENIRMIENYKELLEKTDYEEIKKEIDECIDALKIIPDEIEKESRISEKSHEKSQMTEEKLCVLKEDIIRAERLYSIYKVAFEREYKLEYVISLKDEKDMIYTAREVSKNLRETDIANKSRKDCFNILTDKYYQSRQYLTEYNLMTENIFTEDNCSDEIEIVAGDDAFVDIINDFKRLDIKARIKGKEVNFYILVDFINDSINENELLLKESDRQLFEDILANTISKKIRARIYHAEQWVKKMNNLMESMDTSSGLSFSLRWRSKSAETEEQMDTQELVKILKSEAALLKEEDFRKLSDHFRSRITEVRKVMEEKGSVQTFHAIMKEILDYRKWFEFLLYYQKTNEPRRELTNNAFNKFSGGEKAMAMYVPLFSAVYARYENGRNDCPRIISLDEAFAGVDSNNIRDMFRLLEELKLNFVLNSQVLWGDYDTVPSLSICELVRPNNADVVTVIRYQWDGKVRRLIS